MQSSRDTDTYRAMEFSPIRETNHANSTYGRPRLDFLAETGRLLSDSFLRSTLTTAAGLALPLLGTWCMVDLVDDDAAIRRLVVLHPNSAYRDRALRFYEANSPRGEPIGVAKILAHNAPDFVVVTTHDALTGVTAERRELLIELGACSFLVVAMRLRGKTLGAITFGSSTARGYGPTDFVVAEELGRRCALTVDSARSYGESQMARVRAEHAFAMEDAARAEFAHALGRGGEWRAAVLSG